MKCFLFKNQFDKYTFVITFTVIVFYVITAFAFKDNDTVRVKKTPDEIPLELYFDEQLTQKVKLPFDNNRSPEIFTLYARLPVVKEGNVVELIGKYRSLTADLQGINFFASEMPHFMGIKTYAGRNLCFIPLNATCSGKVLTIRLSLQKNPYGSNISKVCISTISTYIDKNLAECMPTYLLSVLLFICSLFSLNAFLFSYLYQKKRVSVDFDISVETFLVSLAIVVWIITNFDVLGVIVGNTAFVGILNYLAFTSMPVFFATFLRSINKKHEKKLRLMQIGAQANLIIQFFLFITGLADFTQLLFMTHIVDIVGVVLTVGVVFDFSSIKKYSLEQKVLCFGSAVFALFAIVSMLLFIFGNEMNYMFLITMGFFLLFGMHMGTSLLKLSVSLKEHQNLLESERNSYRDQLTNLGNRRLYYRKIAKLEALGFEDDMNFIMIDVNGLKSINDSQGHDAGDELLVGTAVCMTESFPDAELICRMGGDEFFIIVKEKADVLEKRMNRFLAYAENWSGKYVKMISVSYGIANQQKFPGFTIPELQKAADEEMYKYKNDYYQHKNMLEEALEGRR